MVAVHSDQVKTSPARPGESQRSVKLRSRIYLTQGRFVYNTRPVKSEAEAVSAFAGWLEPGRLGWFPGVLMQNRFQLKGECRGP